MEEKGSKRREWVKNAAIIFLTVLLILTFFSQTILNYSLPEVAAQYAQSGTITAKIRGTGTVESGDPYNVTATQTRTVASVAVRVGDEVQAGDILVYLEDMESEELKAAEAALRSAESAYNALILKAEVQAGWIKEADNVSVAAYRNQITAAQTAVNNAQAEVDRLQREFDNLAETSNVPSEVLEAYKVAKKNLAEYKVYKDNADAEVDALTKKYNYYYDTVSGNDMGVNIQELKKALQDAQQVQLYATLNYNAVERDYNTALANLEAAQSGTTGSLTAAQKLLEERQKTLDDLISKIDMVLEIENASNTLKDAQEEYAKQQEKATDAVITSKISGTVTTVNAVAGKEIANGETVVVLQPEGQGYTMSFTVTNEQAQRLSVGDRAELVNSWRYDDVEVVIASIRPDPTNPGASKILNFNITGSVTAGQTLSVSVGQRSSNYDVIVPNSAIREDNNGKFVLVVESKSSPLGNRYIATRMNVEVLASDDTQSAISGLSGYEFVITTSTQPVEAGQQVRLANN